MSFRRIARFTLPVLVLAGGLGAGAGCSSGGDAIVAPASEISNGAVPLAAVPAPVLAAAGAFLHRNAAWKDATLATEATPLFQPEGDAPSHYELKVVREGRPAGYIEVSADEGNRIVGYELGGISPTDQVREGAAEAAAVIARFVRVSAFDLIAEDAAGDPVVTAKDVPHRAEPSLRARWDAMKHAASTDRRTQREATLAPGTVQPMLMKGDPGDKGENGGGGCGDIVQTYVFGKPGEGVPNYDQVDGSRVGGAFCRSGCAATGLAMLFGWANHQRYRPVSPNVWSTPGVENAFHLQMPGNASVTWPVFAPIGMPSIGTFEDAALMKMIQDLRNNIGTYCSGNQGSTVPQLNITLTPNTIVNGVLKYIADNRLPMSYTDRFSPFVQADYMSDVTRVVGYRWPVMVSVQVTDPDGLFESVTGVGSLHFPVVDGYDSCGYLHVNMGHGGSQNRWMSQFEMKNSIRYIGHLTPGGSGYAAPLRGGVRIGTFANKCVDVAGYGTANGTRTQQWDCLAERDFDTSKSVPNQIFTLTPAGEVRGYGGKCFDVAGWSTANGTPVQMWDCNGSAAQRFTFTPGGQIVGLGNKCIDVAGISSATGAGLQMWDCNGNANQTFRIYARDGE